MAPVLAGTTVAAREYGTDVRLAVILAVAFALLAWLYSAFVRLRVPALAEVPLVILFTVITTCVTAYVQEQSASPLAFGSGVALGCLAAVAVVLDRGRGAGEEPPAARWFLFGLLFAAFEVPVLTVALRLGPPAALLALLGVPLAFVIARRIPLGGSATLLSGVALTAALQVVFALLWSAGLLLQPS